MLPNLMLAFLPGNHRCMRCGANATVHATVVDIESNKSTWILCVSCTPRLMGKLFTEGTLYHKKENTYGED